MSNNKKRMACTKWRFKQKKHPNKNTETKNKLILVAKLWIFLFLLSMWKKHICNISKVCEWQIKNGEANQIFSSSGNTEMKRIECIRKFLFKVGEINDYHYLPVSNLFFLSNIKYTSTYLQILKRLRLKHVWFA